MTNKLLADRGIGDVDRNSDEGQTVQSGVIGAIRYALYYHKDQKYGTEDFFSTHLNDVAEVAVEYNLPVRVYIAAWLHDIVEDTKATITMMYEVFGPEVAELVEAVTNEPGKNRAERANKTLPKIRKTGTNAVALKLCDRISNVRACLENNASLLKAYQKEHIEFKKILYREGELGEMWAKLDGLIKGNGK